MLGNTGLKLRHQRIIRDTINIMRYGFEAPRWSELIWIDPRRCLGNPFPKEPGYLKYDSARVIAQWPSTEPEPIVLDPRVKECLRHWVNGVSWEETGRIEAWLEVIRQEGSIYGCRTRQEILDRCAKWDAIFAHVRKEGRLRSQYELRGPKHREFGGIGIHVGPDGQLYKGRDGHHRFAMALALDLPLIPAVLGLVSADSVATLKTLRRDPFVLNSSFPNSRTRGDLP